MERAGTVPGHPVRAMVFLAAFVVITAAAVAVVFAGGTLRASLGVAAVPGDPGREPAVGVAAGEAMVRASRHETLLPAGQVMIDPGARVAEHGAAGPASAAGSTASAALPADRRGQVALERARAAFERLAWGEAESAARAAETGGADEATSREASGLAALSRRAAQVFTALNQRDELRRSWETHPSLVRLGDPRTGTLAVPLARNQGSGPEPIVAPGDPVAFVTDALAHGEVELLVQAKSQFVRTTVRDPQQVTRVDVASVIAAARRAIGDRIAALETGPDAGDALAWYALARSAYRNRVDDLVAEPLRRAMELDADLVTTVRDDQAARLLASLVFHVTNANSMQANVIYGRLIPAYADTAHGRLAEDYWTRHHDASTAIPGAKPAPAIPAPLDPPAIRPRQLEGPDASFEAGRQRFAKAQDMLAVPARDQAYRQVIADFDVALAGYAEILKTHPQDLLLQDRMTEARSLRYAAIHYLMDAR